MGTHVQSTFLVHATDQPGLVARIAGVFYDSGLNILDASNFTDFDTESAPPQFFMRVVVDATNLTRKRDPSHPDIPSGRESLELAFEQRASEISAKWSVVYSDVPTHIGILVTKEASCLYDLLLCQREGELPGTIAFVASNHRTLEGVAESFGIPFFFLPITPETKPEQERGVLELIEKYKVKLVVLARYMQVVTQEFLARAPHVINIHHGFLPAFQGAKPYHQAHARGVKIIGATAHYATRDLDQGPIIEQDVVRVTHQATPAEMARMGRNVERVVLTRAVRSHLEHRIITHAQRTIIL